MHGEHTEWLLILYGLFSAFLVFSFMNSSSRRIPIPWIHPIISCFCVFNLMFSKQLRLAKVTNWVSIKTWNWTQLCWMLDSCLTPLSILYSLPLWRTSLYQNNPLLRKPGKNISLKLSVSYQATRTWKVKVLERRATHWDEPVILHGFFSGSICCFIRGNKWKPIARLWVRRLSIIISLQISL